MTRDHPKDSTEYCCVGREQFEATHAPSLCPCRNETNRAFTLAAHIGMGCEHFLHRALLLAAGQRYVDRLEIESSRLELIAGR